MAFGCTTKPSPAGDPDGGSPEVAASSSDKLQQTVIVPTLDSPVPANRSAIWCASFQLAWNRFKNDVTRGPVQIQNAEEVANRLNHAELSEDDLDPTAYFAGAGLARDGIVAKIQNEMAAKFPDVPRPDLGDVSGGAVAFAYLRAQVKYTHAFTDYTERFYFRSSAGDRVAVRSFGIRLGDPQALRDQVQILFKEGEEFALDLCRHSAPNQVVLAQVPWQGTLQATLARLREKTAAKQASTRSPGPHDTLQVPAMDWHFDHRFRELEGRDKVLLNPSLQGLYVDTARQRVRFRLYRSGAEMEAEAHLKAKSAGPLEYYGFNQPFLLCMQKRGANQPFLVLWVDNAELLSRL
jgi:hypothetical protein